MTNVLTFVALCLFAIGATSAAKVEAARFLRDVPTVASLNVSEYLGLWYQTYTDGFNSLFETQPYCATATYGVNENGTISVLNFDRKGGYNGTAGVVNGYAYQPDAKAYPGRLEVVFPFNPLPAPYWVLKLGPVVNEQYQYSIVSDFDRLSLFVLTRNVTTYYEKYNAELQTWLIANGYDGIFNNPQQVPQGAECIYG